MCNKGNGTGPNNFWGLQFIRLVLCTLKIHYFLFVVYYKSTHEHNTGRLNSLYIYSIFITVLIFTSLVIKLFNICRFEILQLSLQRSNNILLNKEVYACYIKSFCSHSFICSNNRFSIFE